MAVDPSIALGVQTPQFNPLAQLAQVAALRDAQQRNQLYDLSIQDKQREVAQNAALNKAYADNLGTNGTINGPGLVTSLAQNGAGAAIPGVQKSLSDAATARIAQQKSQVELGLQHVNAIGQILGSVKDEPTYQAALRTAANTFGPDSISDLPAQYDPNVVNQHLAQTLTYKDQLEQANKHFDQQLQTAQFGETQRHNTATEDSTVRGQNLTAATETRGQDLRANEYDPKTNMIVNKATGQARPATGLDGQPIATPTGNLTGEQSNAVAFGARALDAQNTLRQLEAGGTNSGGRFAQGLENLPWVGGALSNGVRSTATLPLGIGAAAQATIAPNEQQQSYEQAQRNFVSAVLRKESGAAISNDEYANEAKKYFPQPGDTPATIEQKARARDLAIEGLKAQAGPGSSLIGGIISNANQDYSNQPRPQTQQSSQPAQPSQSQATLSGLSDEQRMALAQQRAARDPAFAARLRALGH